MEIAAEEMNPLREKYGTLPVPWHKPTEKGSAAYRKISSAFLCSVYPCFLVLSLREPGVVPNCFLNVVMKDETE